MPNPPQVYDHNYAPIEVAIKQTSRGRAFLAEYARRVRQSDTLTLLAMIGRLERVCQDLAVRLAEPDVTIESPAGPAPKSNTDQALAVADGLTNGDQNGQPLERIAHVVNALRKFDRRVAELNDCRIATSFYPETSPFADTNTVKSGGDMTNVRSAEVEASERLFPSTPDLRKHCREIDVLEDIAKALGKIA